MNIRRLLCSEATLSKIRIKSLDFRSNFTNYSNKNYNLGILTSELPSCNLSMLSEMVVRILESRSNFTNYSNQDYNLGILTSELPSCNLSMLSEMVVRKQIRQWIYNINGYYNRGKTKNSYWSVCSTSRRGKMDKGI